MLTVNEALQKAASTASWTIGMCDNFVANMYGFSNSGYNTALDHWNAIPAQDKHPGDTNNPPAGALVFWGGGFGHVAIADGSGNVYSTDIGGPGTVSKVPQSQITQKWGKPFLGWSQPYFSGSTTGVGSSSPVVQASALSDLSGLESGVVSDLTSGLMDSITIGVAGVGSKILQWGMWGLEFIFGMILMGMGTFVIMKRTVS